MDAQLVKKAKEIIERINYISLATTNAKGDPWNTPLVAIHNKKYHFYWRSAKDAIHSQNIKTNQNIFIVIYSTTISNWESRQAVYIQAKANELANEEEINKILPLIDKQSGATFGNAEKYLKYYPRRVYKAIPEKVWINVEGETNSEFVDKRIEIQLTK